MKMQLDHYYHGAVLNQIAEHKQPEMLHMNSV